MRWIIAPPDTDQLPAAAVPGDTVGMINRRLILIMALVAMTGVASVAYATAQAGSASQFIHQLGNQAITTLQTPGITLEEREARFRGILRQGFDVPFIGRFVLGRYWKKTAPEVRSDYLNLFSEYLLQIYSARLGGYAGETLSVIDERPAGTKDVVVRTRIVRPSGPPITAEWRVRIADGRPRIVNIKGIRAFMPGDPTDAPVRFRVDKEPAGELAIGLQTRLVGRCRIR